jgi:hypothetical protein
MHFLDNGPQPQPRQGTGDRLAGRIMAAEYNLAVQRGDSRQAASILAVLAGQLLTDRESH